MKQTSKDETRWLLRLFAILVIGFAVQGVIFQYQRVVNNNEPIFIFVAVPIILLLFWLGYRLWICPSIWNVFSSFIEIFPGGTPASQFFQYQYFRINQHIRCGFIAGLILLFLDKVIFVLPILYKGVAFWESARYIWTKVIWPPRRCFEILHLSESPLVMFLVFCIYIFTLGFIVGWCLSYLKERFLRDKEINDMYRSQDAESSSCGDG